MYDNHIWQLIVFNRPSAKKITYTEIEITCSNTIKDAVEENCDYDDYWICGTLISSAERQVKDSGRSRMYQSWYFGDKIGHAKSVGFRFYCWFSHGVTEIQSTKLSILPRFYFHDVLEQLKTNFHTNFRFKRVLGFVIEYAWISKLLRDAAFTWPPKELSR